MSDGVEETLDDVRELVARLAQSPVDYRHALSVLDAEYPEWRPDCDKSHSIAQVAGVPLLHVADDVFVLAEVTREAAEPVARHLAQCDLDVVHVPGEPSFHALRDHLTDGQWRLSRNYEATADGFLPRPSPDVRELTPDDRPLVEAACEAFPVMKESPSMLRDFGYMCDGLPVPCYGAMENDTLVGFCSANPISVGVTEISWLGVAEGHRRAGYASGMLTEQAERAVARGDRVGYYAGSGGDDLDAMLLNLGFREMLGDYRFIPASTSEQWQTLWGRPV